MSDETVAPRKLGGALRKAALLRLLRILTPSSMTVFVGLTYPILCQDTERSVPV